MSLQNKLRWRCRRGMRELDMVFEGYLDQYYDSAGVEQKAAFERLIDCSDADIYSWLMAYAEPPDPSLHELVGLMRRLLSDTQTSPRPHSPV